MAIRFWLSAVLLCGMACARAGTVTYVYTDTQGTPLAEADASGNITVAFDYRPYGSVAMGSAPAGPGYTGHVSDPDTGFMYMQARFYDPDVGSFLSVDPEPKKPGDLYSADRYGYANSNPQRYTDPDGRYACGSSDKKICGRIEMFVSAMNQGLAKLNKGSGEYKALSEVSQHIGKPGDNNGVTLNPGQLRTGVIAQADTATTMTIDVDQAGTLSAPFRKYNQRVNATELANAFGGSAVAHEGTHQLDYIATGYPTGRTSEHATEMNAYKTELGVAKGLGISTDLYAPGALQKDIDTRVRRAADASTDLWCKSNGC